MRIKNLSFSFGMQNIFDNVNLYIPDNEKVGIVGVNGAGKSTFFNILTKKISPDDGQIIFDKKTRVELLPQVITDEVSLLDINVFDYLSSGRPIEKLENDLQNLYNDLASADEKSHDSIYKKINKVQEKLEYWEQFAADTILLKIIEGMNITSNLLDKKLGELSGGQKSTIAFAKLLYSKPEVMLLDEPTNHLDSSTKDYIINFLSNYRGTVFMISHDIDFLNKVSTKILYLDKMTHNMSLYNGNYNDFNKLHSEQVKTLEEQAKIQQMEEDKLRAIVKKYEHGNGNRKKMAQDREKKLTKLLANKIELAPTTKKMNLDISITRESGMTPLKVDNLSFKYDKSAKMGIINKLSFSVHKGEKFLIVGQNGVGKSTLLKMIVGKLIPDDGVITIGNHTDIGYYAQEHELLDMDKTILDNFDDMLLSPKIIRNVLGRFLFFGDDVFKKVKVLSPGEQSRVALAKLSVTGANFLILDEPTNHLDPETQKIIAETFKTFKGTMLVVSHNPEFVDNLGIERVLILPSGKTDFYSHELVESFHKLNTNKLKKINYNSCFI